MLRWAFGFFIIAIVAGFLGFGGIATGAADIARVCFFFFIVIFVVSLIWGLASGRRPQGPLIDRPRIRPEVPGGSRTSVS